MATEKTAEGIRKFSADIVKLEKFVAIAVVGWLASPRSDDQIQRDAESALIGAATNASRCLTSSWSSRRFRRIPATSGDFASPPARLCISSGRWASRSTTARLKRAGLDYWAEVDVRALGFVWSNWKRRKTQPRASFTSRQRPRRPYHTIAFQPRRFSRLRPGDEGFARIAAAGTSRTLADHSDARHAQPQSRDRGGDRSLRSRAARAGNG